MTDVSGIQENIESACLNQFDDLQLEMMTSAWRRGRFFSPEDTPAGRTQSELRRQIADAVDRVFVAIRNTR